MATFKESINAIKSRISCVEYAQRNGLPINKSGDRCVSPLRSGAKNNTSFWVFDDHWHDWGSDVSGDVIDLAAALKHNGNKSLAIRELAQMTGVDIGVQSQNEWVDYTQNLCNKIQHFHEKLTDEDREYLHNRRISDETIDRLKIGRTDNGRLSFPYWKNGYICYYASRHLTGGALPKSKWWKMPIDDYNEHTVWGLHSIEANKSRDLLVIAEGAFDALSFEQEGYSVISAITGSFSANEQLPTALSIARMFKKVFLVYDNDVVSRAGEKFTLKMARILTENRIPCLVGSVPPAHKDISEYYAAGGNLAEIINNAVDGIEFLATKITDLEEFEAFARKVCRYKTAPQVDLFFKAVANADIFDGDFLKSLNKECKRAPSDDDIAKEVLEKHKLLYHPNISFFEYNGKYWEKKSDTAIESYIKESLGPYTTGPKLSSISRVIKASVVTDKLFNVNPVMNFINGTVELLEEEPYYEFREHSEDDYCTYCLDYPYDPKASPKEWQHFIDTVTDFDDKRISFLQEFAGYILYHDNRLQKCAALVGDGANGKSIYFNTLAKLFGEGNNVSNIAVKDLSSPFQAIQLLGSMLNISAETRTDFADAEETFKQVVSGDNIFACYKGKDFISFKPRAKMILSLNNYPKFEDKSSGLSRRFAFIEFPLKFVEVPKEPNERLLDTTLESKFTQNEQLSAIFNWVLQGYVMVRACGYLTETNEHIRVLNEIEEDSDPIISFVKDLEFTLPLSYAQIYELYKNWCLDNCYKPCPSRQALRFMGKHFKKYRKDVEPYMSNGVRGYRPVQSL